MLSRLEQYHELKRNPLYVDVHYDARTGGLQATHVEHHFDAKRGYYEKFVQEFLFAHGHKVILESEVSKIVGAKTPDGTLNDAVFDIKAIEGTGFNTIKRKFNEALSQGCEHWSFTTLMWRFAMKLLLISGTESIRASSSKTESQTRSLKPG